ncbi:AMP-binding protein [Rhodococcus sp. 3Y1]
MKFGQLTSGSTGKPSSWPLRERPPCFAETIPALYGATPDSRILTAADLSFGYGFGNSVLIPLLTGTTAVLWNQPTATDELISTLVAHKIDIAALSPRIWAAIARRSRNTAANHDLAGLSTAVSAGEPCPTICGKSSKPTSVVKSSTDTARPKFYT